MDHIKSYRILFWGCLIGLICALIGAASELVLLSIIGLVIMAAAFFQGFLFFKCPHCGEGWNIRGAKPDYCPRCGKKIDW